MSKIGDLVHGQLNEVSAPMAFGALNNRWSLVSAADFSSDLDVLNYALTLEYIESSYYTQGNAAGLTSGQTKDYMDLIGSDEDYHVTAITATIKQLGGTPVSKPGVDFGAAFDSLNSYLTASQKFENTGVGAYLGAAGYIKNKAVLQAAAGIFGVEARHAAIVGNLLNMTPEGGVYMGAFETPISKATVLKDVAPYLSQMTKMPSGGVQTGGGSTSGLQDKGLLSAGGALIVAGGAAAAYAATRRSSATAEQNGPTE